MPDPIDAALNDLAATATDGPVAGWPEPASLRQRADRRKRRRAVLAGGAGGLGAVALAVVLATSLLQSPPPRSRSTNPPSRYGASVRQVPLGGGAVHLVVAGGSSGPPSRARQGLVGEEEAGFAAALTRELYHEGGAGSNVLTSPLSADVALSMLELGARGATQSGITQALQAGGVSAEAESAGWAAMLTALGQGLGPVRFNIADSAWMQRGIVFEQPFLSALARDYGDAAYQADFSGDNLGATQAINEWVAKETAGRIRQLFAPGSLDPSTILVLANALHFRAAWAKPVTFVANGNEVFHAATGTGVSVPVMLGSQVSIGVGVSSQYTAVKLPYAGGRFSALVVQPNGSMASFLGGLSAARIASIAASARPAIADLTMPTLSLSNNSSMNRALTALGMGQAFSPAADLSGISPAAAEVSDVQQANRLVVAEWGTDFASATGIGITASARVGAVTVTIDRPFVFLLRDDQTSVIVAAAVVNNPLAASA
jgi:serpin B